MTKPSFNPINLCCRLGKWPLFKTQYN